MNTEEIKKKLKGSDRSDSPSREGLSTGSTLLNLALSGHAEWGLLPGHYYYFVGDTNSGKSICAHTVLAEASINPHYKDYRLIYKDLERASLMDREAFFGKKFVERLECDETKFPGTVEEFYYCLDDQFKAGKPFIDVLDSMDTLESEADQDKFQEKKKAHEKGKEAAGSYGVAKAKANSVGLRGVMGQLKTSGSILIIISQTRDELGFGFSEKTRAGGRALSFWATCEVWSKVVGKITKTYKDEERHIGNLCRFTVKRTRVTGRQHSVDIPFYWSVGLDDVGSCVQYLQDEKHWTKEGRSIVAPEFDFKGTPERLIGEIEEKGKEKELLGLVAKTWGLIEEACKIRRKNRYE